MRHLSKLHIRSRSRFSSVTYLVPKSARFLSVYRILCLNLYMYTSLNNCKLDWHFENVVAANRHSIPISFLHAGRSVAGFTASVSDLS
jgi:hypothetical protein